MKYNLRFFVRDSDSKLHSETSCIANVKSAHLPCKGDLVYLSDDILDYKPLFGKICKVLYVVKVYDVNGCTSFEILIRGTNI